MLGAGGGQSRAVEVSGWLTPGPGSPAFRLGMARQADCAGVDENEAHDVIECIKAGRQFSNQHHGLAARKQSGNCANESNQAAAGVSCTACPWL